MTAGFLRVAIGFLLGVGATGAGVLLGAAGPLVDPGAPLVWRGHDGRERMRLTEDDQGTVRLDLLDAGGKARISLGVKDESSWLRVGRAGETHLNLSDGVGTARLEIADERKLAVSLSADEDGVRLLQMNGENGPRALLSVNEGSHGGRRSSLELRPRELAPAAWAEISWRDEDGGGSVSIQQRDGVLRKLE